MILFKCWSDLPWRYFQDQHNFKLSFAATILAIQSIMTDKRYQMDNLSPNRLSHSSPEVKDSPLERQVIYYRIHITLILLLVTAAALRLVGLGASFWYDEVNVADQAIGNYSFSERLEIIEKWRGAAPMYDLLLWQWSSSVHPNMFFACFL
ncbi:MAG: hypothetical protein IPI28_16920 [Candidatus Omnitrophica bacterium]|nr:hypothetical protein [Candidatus Omnitrophota bacterium]